MYLKRIQSLKKVKSFSAYELPRFEFPRLTDSFVGHYLPESSPPPILYTATEERSSSESFRHEKDEDSRVHKDIREIGDVEHHAAFLYRARSTKSIKDPKLVNTSSRNLRLPLLNRSRSPGQEWMTPQIL